MRLVHVTILCGLLLSAASGVSQISAPSTPAAATEDESPSQSGLQAHVAEMFAKGEYDAIDRIADRARAEKTRLRGGIWSIRHVYNGFGIASSLSYEDSIGHLRAWMAHNPQSITARIALAEVYVSYAWDEARTGHAEKLSPEDRKVFDERIAQAHALLDEAATLPTTCPEWYLPMLSIAKAEGWNIPKTQDLFEKAVAYEPGYFYYYDSYANFLLPGWQGSPGRAASFVKQTADNAGGQQGDFLYFEMAAHIVADLHFDTQQLDWDRVVRGHEVLNHLYRSVNYDRNQLAFLAWRFQRSDTAKQQFDQIGDKFARTIWRDPEQFNAVKRWAETGGPIPVAAVR